MTVGSGHAILEFDSEGDGIIVNGTDIMNSNSAGKIVDFKIRPLKTITMRNELMVRDTGVVRDAGLRPIQSGSVPPCSSLFSDCWQTMNPQ